MLAAVAAWQLATSHQHRAAACHVTHPVLFGGQFMRAMRAIRAALAAGAFVLVALPAAAQDTPQALKQEIDQVRRDFEALKQQYGDRLTPLESKLAAAEGTPPAAPQPPAPPAAAAAPAGSPPAPVPPGAEGAGGPI